jgi:hypothetical protein
VTFVRTRPIAESRAQFGWLQGGQMHIFTTRTPRPAAIRGADGATAAAAGREAAADQPAPAGPVDRRQLEKSVSWTRGERLRCVWYRLRLTVAEMNYASRRKVELQMRL